MTINWKSVGACSLGLIVGSFFSFYIYPPTPIPKNGYRVQNNMHIMTLDGETYYKYDGNWFDVDGEMVPRMSVFVFTPTSRTLDYALKSMHAKEKIAEVLGQ